MQPVPVTPNPAFQVFKQGDIKLFGYLSFADIYNLTRALLNSKEYHGKKLTALLDRVNFIKSIFSKLLPRLKEDQERKQQLIDGILITKMTRYAEGATEKGCYTVLNILINHDLFGKLCELPLKAEVKAAFFVTACRVGALHVVMHLTPEVEAKAITDGMMQACKYSREGVLKDLFLHPSIGQEDFDRGFMIACEKDNIPNVISFVVDQRLKDDKLGEGLVISCRSGVVWLAEYLKGSPRIQEKYWQEGFLAAFQGGHERVVLQLLKDHPNLNSHVVEGVRCAIIHKHPALVPQFIPALPKERYAAIFIDACQYNAPTVVERLWRQKEINEDVLNEGFLNACACNAEAVVPLINVSATELNQGFKNAITGNGVKVVQFLRQNTLLTAKSIQDGFLIACTAGFDKCIEALIDHDAITRQQVGEGFRVARQRGSISCLKVLLQNQKLEDDILYDCFLESCYNIHIEIFKVLLSSPRIPDKIVCAGWIRAGVNGANLVVEEIIKNRQIPHALVRALFLEICFKYLFVIFQNLQNHAAIDEKCIEEVFVHFCKGNRYEFVRSLLDHPKLTHAGRIKGLLSAVELNSSIIDLVKEHPKMTDEDINRLFLEACASKNPDKQPFFVLKDHAKVTPETFKKGLLKALNLGNKVVVESLLQCSKANGEVIGEVFFEFCRKCKDAEGKKLRYGFISDLSAIVPNRAFKPLFCHDMLAMEVIGKGFIELCRQGKLSYVMQLKDHPKLSEQHLGAAFKEACKKNRFHLVKLLFLHPKLAFNDLKEGFQLTTDRQIQDLKQQLPLTTRLRL